MIFPNPDNQIIATVVEDDVAWGLAARHVPAAQIRARVDEALERVGLADSRNLPPHRLSDGQRQRLAIASALAVRPRGLIADEPTALLDPLARRDVARLLRQLNHEAGLTIVHVTHLLEEAALADRVVVMDEGRIALSGAPAMVFADLDRLRALGLAIPEPLELAGRLRAAGWGISPGALSLEAIASEISS
jgi:energy-coupling factor transport system ATP-binding protein